MEFVDRTLKCSDCSADFIFTAGEQLFFADKQFKNDPKRCKPCKARRSGHLRAIAPGAVPSLPLSRLETRTRCSSCGIDTTVPFKPTQGRPVLCRSCFQLKRVPSGVAAAANLNDPRRAGRRRRPRAWPRRRLRNRRPPHALRGRHAHHRADPG